jgi:hypothetical protein
MEKLTEVKGIKVTKIKKIAVTEGGMTDLAFYGKDDKGQDTLISVFSYPGPNAAQKYADKFGAKFDKQGICVLK